MRPEGSGRARKLALGWLTAAALAAAAECGVRAAGWAPPKRELPLPEFVNADFRSGFPIERDSTLFWRLVPNAAIPDLDETINPDGFRGPKTDRPKPPGARRILCLGDSSTFGSGVAEDATYARRLERWLADSPTRWDVVNVGVPGYSNYQSRRFLETRAAELEPDVVTVYVGSWNDYMPAVGGDDATLAGRAKSWEAGRRGLSLERSHLFRWLRQLLAGMSSESQPSRIKEEYARNYFTRHERPDGPRVTAADFRENLRRIARLTKEMAARPVFLTPPLPAKTRERVADGEDYARIVREVAAEQNATLADARERLTRPIEDDPQYFADGVHPNEDGHAVIAETVAAALRRAGIVEITTAPPPVLAGHGIELKPLQAKASLRDVATGEALPSEKYDANNPKLIVVPSPTALRFDGLEIPSRAALIVWLSRRREGPESLPANPDATIEFAVSLVRTAGEPVEILRRSVTSTDAGWNRPVRVRVDLSSFAGQVVSLVFTTRGSVYRACWGAAAIQPYH